MKTEPTYLGAGVCVKYDGFHVVLTIDGLNDPGIFLDQTVWQALVDYGNSAFGLPVTTIYGDCSVCGEPIDDDDPEIHTDYGGEDCHARCCPVCHEGEPPYAA